MSYSKIFVSIKECIATFTTPNHTAEKLKKDGFSVWAAKAAGYSLKELFEGGYSVEDLNIVGYSKDEVEALIKNI